MTNPKTLAVEFLARCVSKQAANVGCKCMNLKMGGDLCIWYHNDSLLDWSYDIRDIGVINVATPSSRSRYVYTMPLPFIS